MIYVLRKKKRGGFIPDSVGLQQGFIDFCSRATKQKASNHQGYQESLTSFKHRKSPEIIASVKEERIKDKASTGDMTFLEQLIYASTFKSSTSLIFLAFCNLGHKTTYNPTR